MRGSTGTAFFLAFSLDEATELRVRGGDTLNWFRIKASFVLLDGDRFLADWEVCGDASNLSRVTALFLVGVCLGVLLYEVTCDCTREPTFEPAREGCLLLPEKTLMF